MARVSSDHADESLCEGTKRIAVAADIKFTKSIEIKHASTRVRIYGENRRATLRGSRQRDYRLFGVSKGSLELESLALVDAGVTGVGLGGGG